MDTIGWDLYLDVKLLGFDNSFVLQKSKLIIEHSTILPFSRISLFLQKDKIPCGGFIKIQLTAKHGQTTSKVKNLLLEHRKIPHKKTLSRIGLLYNKCQKFIQKIPVVGKALEEIAPDAFQRINLNCYIEMASDRNCCYKINLMQSSDSKKEFHKGEYLLQFKGTTHLQS